MSKHHIVSHFQFLSEVIGRSHEWLRVVIYTIDFSHIPPIITDHSIKSIPQKSVPFSHKQANSYLKGTGSRDRIQIFGQK
jgi:hypothetical protein